MKDGRRRGAGAQKGRVPLWDNIKFLMILCVVIGHFADRFTTTSEICKGIFMFVYAFHMPVLIFVSGYFYSARRMRQKIAYYVFAGFALKVFIAIIQLCIYHETDFRLLSDSLIPWYYFVLAIYQVLMYATRDIDRVFLLVSAFVLACFVGYDASVGDYLYLSRTIVFFPFFLLGTMARERDVLSAIDRRRSVLVPLAALTLVAWLFLSFWRLDVLYVLRQLFTGRNAYSVEVIDHGAQARLLVYLISLLSGASIIMLTPRRRIPILTSLGARTEQVYFWHWELYIIFVNYSHVYDWFPLSPATKALYFLLAIVLTVLTASIDLFAFPTSVIRRVCFAPTGQKRETPAPRA